MEDVVMRRRDKIVVSIVGIFMVLLVLLGITYAYFLTRIHGNTNDKSVDITTADLELTYNDGTGLLSKENIQPGDVIGEKTFTVTNTGSITIENYGVYLEEVINTFSIKDDVTYTLTCESSVENKTCNGVENETFPSLNERIVTNSIDKDEVQTYKIKVEYAETGTDQSIDMNKRLEARIQIYNEKDVVYLEGNVTGHSDGDYVVVESTPKKSRIVDGMYRVVGLKPGNHTIKVIGSDSSERGTKNFSVVKGKEESISGDVVTINSDTDYIIMDIGAISSGLQTNIVEVGEKIDTPFEKGTLANAIYVNSLKENNGTKLVSTPETIPAQSISNKKNYKENEGILAPKTKALSLTYTSTTIYYYDGYTVDSKGKFTLTGVGSCKYKDCYNSLAGKYIYGYAEYASSSDITTNRGENPSSYYIHKITSTDESKIYYSPVYAVVDEAERELSIETDDYGTSYYYRGDVKDNYINFAGKCFKVVRIEGDGSIKIILEDNATTCDSDTFIGNWVIGNTTTWGYVYKNGNYIGDYLNSTTELKSQLDNWYNENLKNKENLLKNDAWCIGYDSNLYGGSSPFNLLKNTRDNLITNGTNFNYEAGRRIAGLGTTKYAQLKCDGNTYESYVGALTVDEVAFAGGSRLINNKYYYLSNPYQRINVTPWLTLSLSSYTNTHDFAFYTESTGDIATVNVNSNIKYYARPVITLATGTQIASGDGTINNPYIISEE